MPADFGLVAMATTFLYGVEALSQLGLQEALVRRREEGLDLHDMAFTLQVGRAFVTACVIAGGAPLAASYFHEPRLLNVLLVLAGITFVNGFENVGIAEFRRAMRYDRQFTLMSLTRVAGFLTTLASALLGAGYWALLLGTAVSSIARVALTYRLHPFRPRLRLLRWRELARFSLWTWATAAASLVWDRCDPFVLGPSFGPAKLGLYLLAMEIAWMPMSELVVPAADALFAAFSRAQKDGKSSVHHAPEVAALILLAVGPAGTERVGRRGTGRRSVAGREMAGRLADCGRAHLGLRRLAVQLYLHDGVGRERPCARQFHRQRDRLRGETGGVAYRARVHDRCADLGAATVGCALLEAMLFMAMLHRVGRTDLPRVAGGFVRIVVGLAASAGVVAWSGLGWRPGLGSVPWDVVTGFAIGAVAAVVSAVVVGLQWLAVGRPPGGEARLIGLVGERAQNGIAKARQAALFWRKGDKGLVGKNSPL